MSPEEGLESPDPLIREMAKAALLQRDNFPPMRD